MQRYKVKVLGCDNGSGEFELGGDLDRNEFECRNELDIGREVAKLAGIEDRYHTNTITLGERRIVTMDDRDHSQQFVFLVEEIN